MAAVETPRFGIYTWPFGSDPFTRDQMNQSHQRIESLAAKFLSGPYESIPPAGDATVRTFYLASDTTNTDNVLVLYYCDGTRWFSINDFDAPGDVFPGQAQSQGTSVYSTRADHVHRTPPWGTTAELQTIKTIATAGSAVSFARADHVHVLGTGSVASTHIQDGAINTTAKLADGIVTTAKIADQAVTRTRILASERWPIGAVMAFAGPVANVPAGWLPAHGASVSRAAYANLFAVIGTTYGSVSGDTFTLPDLRGAFVCGVNDGGWMLGTKSLGVTGGSDTKTLLLANLPPHQHNVNHDHDSQATDAQGNHNHGIPSGGGLGSGSNGFGLGLLSIAGTYAYTTQAAGNHAHNFNVNPYTGLSGVSGGTSTPLDIRPPFIHLYYIIKT
jgi:microcystin-dependent protein